MLTIEKLNEVKEELKENLSDCTENDKDLTEFLCVLLECVDYTMDALERKEDDLK